MMWTQTLLFALFALLLGGAAWFSWRQRQIAQEQARMNDVLAALGRSIQDITHDLHNLVSLIIINVASASEMRPEEVPQMLADVEQGARTAVKLIQAIRGGIDRRPSQPGSVEGVVRLHVALLRRKRVPIHTTFEDDLPYHGLDADAVRVVQNLLFNAIREAEQVPSGAVTIELARGALRISNPVRAPERLDASIYARGVSGASSSGLGLGIAREAAERLGWSLRHEVVGRRVTFVVEPDRRSKVPPRDEAAPRSSAPNAAESHATA